MADTARAMITRLLNEAVVGNAAGMHMPRATEIIQSALRTARNDALEEIAMAAQAGRLNTHDLTKLAQSIRALKDRT